MSGGKKFSFECWLDEWKLSFAGIGRVLTCPRFFVPAAITFVIFGVLLNLLAGGTMGFTLLGAGQFSVLGDAFLKIFGINQPTFLDWLYTFAIALLQGILLGLVVFVFKSRKDSANLQNAGIVAGLAILGSGCPTCGTTLLMPVLVSIAGSSSMALASTVSWLLTAASIVVALLAMKKVGFEAFAIVEDERYRKKHAEELKAAAEPKKTAKSQKSLAEKSLAEPKNSAKIKEKEKHGKRTRK